MEMSVLRRWLDRWIRGTLRYRELEAECADLVAANATLAASNTAAYAQWVAVNDALTQAEAKASEYRETIKAERDQHTVDIFKAQVSVDNASILINMMRSDLAVRDRIISELENLSSRRKKEKR